MEQATINQIERDIQLAHEGKITFLETVQNLMEVGIERYLVDITAQRNTYYAQNGDVHTITRLVSHDHTYTEDTTPFSQEGVIAALRAIQHREIDYPEFMRRIFKAGAVGYSAFLSGKQVHYFGAQGELYIEKFPQ